jgi:glyoxylase-like metal-dependent hydrolase (beta-lactamase superfamily II)
VRPEPVHLGDRVRAFGSELGDESLPGWKFVFTPGHSPGHLAFFRAEDEILLAGDAVTTMNLDSFWAVLTKTRRVTRPPAPVTCDWPAAAESVRRLADLQPATIAAGHGVPMSGDRAVLELAELATDFPFLPRGRYAKEPAVACETGVVSLPPKPHDSLVGTVAGLGIAAAAGAMFAIAERRRRTKADTQTQAS